jgi:hypothetical protein
MADGSQQSSCAWVWPRPRRCVPRSCRDRIRGKSFPSIIHRKSHAPQKAFPDTACELKSSTSAFVVHACGASSPLCLLHGRLQQSAVSQSACTATDDRWPPHSVPGARTPVDSGRVSPERYHKESIRRPGIGRDPSSSHQRPLRHARGLPRERRLFGRGIGTDAGTTRSHNKPRSDGWARPPPQRSTATHETHPAPHALCDAREMDAPPTTRQIGR